MSDVTLESLKEEVREIVKSEFADMLEDRYYQSRLTEIADGSVPIYNADRASVFASEPGLEVSDLGLAQGKSSIIDLIGIAIYEELIQEANQAYEDLKSEYEDLKDMAESDGVLYDYIKGKHHCLYKLKDEDADDEEENREYLVEEESSEADAWIELFKQDRNW